MDREPTLGKRATRAGRSAKVLRDARPGRKEAVRCRAAQDRPSPCIRSREAQQHRGAQGARMRHSSMVSMASVVAPAAMRACGKPARYTAPVTSKKGVIGIGVPKHLCDASRRFLRRDSAALSFVPPFFGGSSREPQGSPVLARGARYANLFELPPPIGVGCGGFCKPHLLEAIHG